MPHSNEFHKFELLHFQKQGKNVHTHKNICRINKMSNILRKDIVNMKDKVSLGLSLD